MASSKASKTGFGERLLFLLELAFLSMFLTAASSLRILERSFWEHLWRPFEGLTESFFDDLMAKHFGFLQKMVEEQCRLAVFIRWSSIAPGGKRRGGGVVCEMSRLGCWREEEDGEAMRNLAESRRLAHRVMRGAIP